MKKGIFYCFAVFTAFMSWMPELFSEPCLPSGHCPAASGDEWKLPGVFECAICGTKNKGGYEDCVATFNGMSIDYKASKYVCNMKPKHCETSTYTSCEKGHTDHCEEIFMNDRCCVCKSDYYGSWCNLPRTIEYVDLQTYSQDPIKLDISNRHECWSSFVHHDLHWKSEAHASRVLVPYKERANDPPFYVISYNAFIRTYFSKFTMSVRKSLLMRWCQAFTNLGAHCNRLNLIFDTSNGAGTEVKRLVFYEAIQPFINTENSGHKHSNAFTMYRKGKVIGYFVSYEINVYPIPVVPPHFKFHTYSNYGFETSINRRRSFSNYTGVDTRCIPQLRHKCNTYYTKFAHYAHMQFSFEMDYTLPPSGCEQTSIQNWQIFKTELNMVFSEGEEFLTRQGCCKVTFPPYTFLKLGIYVLKFTMMHIQNGEKIYNWKPCIHYIYADKIKAKFREFVKNVNKEEWNKVEVEALDINNPPGHQKEGLMYSWSCKFNGTDKSCPEIEKSFKSSPVIEIPPDRLQDKSFYILTVCVQSSADMTEMGRGDTSASVYQKLIVTSLGPYQITLICSTCDDASMIDPKEYNFIYIRAKDGVSQPYPTKYTWQFADESDGVVSEFRSVENIREETSNILLKIKINALEPEKSYVFQAMSADSKVMAQIRVVTTSSKSWDLNCTLNPLEGIRGWTDFNFECEFENETLFFEYYDRDENDDRLFSGRMLGYNDFGFIRNFKMTKGTFFVLIYDNEKGRHVFTQNVRLFPYNHTLQYLEELLGNAQETTKWNQFDWSSATVSSVAEVTEKGMNPSDATIKQPIFILHRVNLSYILGLLKLVLSSLKTVLSNIAKKFDVFKVDPYLVKCASDTLNIITVQFMHHERNIANEKTLTETVFYEMIKAVYDCAEIILQQNNQHYKSKTEEYDLFFISHLVEETSLTIVSALESTSYSLNSQFVPGNSATEVVSEQGMILTNTKVDFEESLSNWTMRTENCSIKISDNVISSVGNTSQLYGLQYIRMQINPFWWAGGNIVSEVILVNICQRVESTQCKKRKRFHNFVALNLEVIKPLNSLFPIEGTAYQVDPKAADEVKELDLTVYRFFLPERAKLFFKFLINDTQEYRVLLRETLRPDYDGLAKNPFIIKATSPDYRVPYENNHPREKVYYMGILPSSNVSIGEKVPFRLKAYYSLCNTWVKWHWTSSGCWVGAKTSEEFLQCDCDHLSVVAGSISMPEHKLVTVSEFMLYLTPWENLLPLYILVIILLLFLLALIWAMVKDRKDRRAGEAIVLDDNFPGEHYAYLLGVHTGSRLFSGTTSTVGVQLVGEKSSSRAHVLRSPNDNLFKTSSENWFVIYTQQNLGAVQILHVWHNDKGISSDWFVEKIEVFDLKTQVQYIFHIRAWIAMEADMTPEICVLPIGEEDYFNPVNLFRHYFVNGLRDTHHWTSVCLKHTRNPVSRVERIGVIACFVLSAMATCLLLYKFHFGFIDEDKPSYYFNKTDMLIFIITLIITSILVYLIMGLFRKSFVHIHVSAPRKIPHIKFVESPADSRSVKNVHTGKPADTQEDTATNYRNQFVPKESQKVLFRMKPHSKRTMCENCAWAVHNFAIGNSLLPVRLRGDKSDLIVHKQYFIPAWILCIGTIILSILIILLNAWKLPTIKDKKFLATFFGVVVFDALILSFFKILCFAAVLSYVFRNTIPMTSYHIKVKVGKRLHLHGNKKFLSELVKKRNNKVYLPLSGSIVEHKRERKIRIYRWRKLLEFLLILILICVISVILKIYYVDHYMSNSHASHMMTTGVSVLVPNLPEVFNRTDVYNFLEINFVSRLFRFIWYNYQPLMDLNTKRLDWTDDCVSRLLGSARIRQLRVSLDDCGVSEYNMSIESCARSWERGSEDTDVYAASWLLADYKDAEQQKTTWRYTESESSNSSRFYGESGTLYHGGGYIAELGYSQKEVRASLLTLEVEEWLDHMTRVVFVELTLYNVNTDLFTQVVLVSEQQPTGQYRSIPKVASVSLNIGFNFWNIGFIIFQFFFLFRAFYFMNRRGVLNYLSNILNIYDFFLLLLGFTTVVLYMVHIKYSSHYVDNYHRKGFHSFFSFFEIVRYYFMSKATMCFLFGCVVVKLIVSWRFGEIYYSFYYSFSQSLMWIMWLALYFNIWLIILWRFIGYKMNIYLFSHYSTPIVYSKDFNVTGTHESLLGHLIVYIMCTSSSFVMFLFIASFAYNYRKGRKLKLMKDTKYYHFDFESFLVTELKRLRMKKSR